MKYFQYAAIFFSIILSLAFFSSCATNTKSGCLTGAFLSDKPSREDIVDFKNNYGKKPFLVMVFVDWEDFVNEEVIEDVYLEDCALVVTWEPWYAMAKEGLGYDEMLSGKWDEYIEKFAEILKKIDGAVFLRFGHEMNGNWYPWSGTKIGKSKFVEIYKYVKDIFDETGASNVKWVFSVNWEDVPREDNNFMLYYPGDEYVDYVGIDGYNWGNAKSWSRWMSFKEIFEKRYKEITNNLKKPIIISEFSSTSNGGDKAVWIKEAMNDIERMKEIKGFVLFNVDKETDWNFPTDEDFGKEFKVHLGDSYFKDGKNGRR